MLHPNGGGAFVKFSNTSFLSRPELVVVVVVGRA